MKQVLISSIAALVLTTGFASADSALGVDQTLYTSQAVVVETTKAPASTFDGFVKTDKSTLPSVNDNLGAQTLGPR